MNFLKFDGLFLKLMNFSVIFFSNSMNFLQIWLTFLKIDEIFQIQWTFFKLDELIFKLDELFSVLWSFFSFVNCFQNGYFSLKILMNFFLLFVNCFFYIDELFSKLLNSCFIGQRFSACWHTFSEIWDVWAAMMVFKLLVLIFTTCEYSK